MFINVLSLINQIALSSPITYCQWALPTLKKQETPFLLNYPSNLEKQFQITADHAPFKPALFVLQLLPVIAKGSGRAVRTMMCWTSRQVSSRLGIN